VSTLTPALPTSKDATIQQVATIPIFSGWLGSWQISLARRAHSTTELAQRYDRASLSWQDTIDQFGFHTAYQHLLRKLFRQRRYALPSGRLQVLDAGIGTGAMASALHTVFDGAVDFEGVDVSSAMLNKAAKRLNDLGITAHLREADIQALPFEDAGFDVVMVAHVLEHLTEPEKALAELHRVLRPGGVVVLCVTRQSTLGTYIQMKWRTHRIAVATGLAWLRRSGFQSVRAIPFPRHSIARHLSIGYVGRKPVLNSGLH